MTIQDQIELTKTAISKFREREAACLLRGDWTNAEEYARLIVHYYERNERPINTPDMPKLKPLDMALADPTEAIRRGREIFCERENQMIETHGATAEVMPVGEDRNGESH